MAEDTCIFLISWRIRGDFAEIQIILSVGRLQNHDAVFRVEAFFDGLQCALCEPLCDADSGEDAEALRFDENLPFLTFFGADFLRLCIVSADEPFAVPAVL